MTIEQAKANQKFLEMKKELSADISYLKDRIENDTECYEKHSKYKNIFKLLLKNVFLCCSMQFKHAVL